MKITVEKGNLFDVDSKFYFVHCISADFALGAGIAKEFEKRFSLRKQLNNMFPNGAILPCVRINNIFNLITKEKYWQKPTYYSLEKSLISLRNQTDDMNIHYLAMPKIGCGLDKLEWEKVLPLIEQSFRNWDGEILVRYL